MTTMNTLRDAYIEDKYTEADDYEITETLGVEVDLNDAIEWFVGKIPIKWFSWKIKRNVKTMFIMFRFEEDGSAIKRVIVEFDLKCGDKEKSVIQKLEYTDDSEFGKFLASIRGGDEEEEEEEEEVLEIEEVTDEKDKKALDALYARIVAMSGR